MVKCNICSESFLEKPVVVWDFKKMGNDNVPPEVDYICYGCSQISLVVSRKIFTKENPLTVPLSRKAWDSRIDKRRVFNQEMFLNLMEYFKTFPRTAVSYQRLVQYAMEG